MRRRGETGAREDESNASNGAAFMMDSARRFVVGCKAPAYNRRLAEDDSRMKMNGAKR